jgi:hypothetical protein
MGDRDGKKKAVKCFSLAFCAFFKGFVFNFNSRRLLMNYDLWLSALNTVFPLSPYTCLVALVCELVSISNGMN